MVKKCRFALHNFTKISQHYANATEIRETRLLSKNWCELLVMGVLSQHLIPTERKQHVTSVTLTISNCFRNQTIGLEDLTWLAENWSELSLIPVYWKQDWKESCFDNTSVTLTRLKCFQKQTIDLTRMHSSRMRTVRSSGRRGGGCLPGRCVCQGVSAPVPQPRGQNDRRLWKH